MESVNMSMSRVNALCEDNYARMNHSWRQITMDKVHV